MHLLGPGSSGSSSGPSMAAVIAMVLASGCAGADAALVEGECNQTDSTVTCCLKQNPGQYEKCGATPPTQQQPSPAETKPIPPEAQPRRPPPLIDVSDNDDDAMTDEEVDKMCREHYVRCIEKRGLKINLQHGTSHCQGCFDLCRKKRYWPWSANGKRCPGG
jgi:hypothetical protein